VAEISLVVDSLRQKLPYTRRDHATQAHNCGLGCHDCGLQENFNKYTRYLHGLILFKRVFI